MIFFETPAGIPAFEAQLGREHEFVASAGIEPASGASEALILSPSDWRQPGGHCTRRRIVF